MTPTDILLVWILGILIFVLLDFLYRMSLSPNVHPIIPEPWDISDLSATDMYEAITDEE